METQSQKMINIIKEVVSVLALSDTKLCAMYRDYLEKILIRLNGPHDLDKIVEDIMPIFGGMGSFNDITLYQGPTVLVEQNRKFEKAADKLFAACQEVIATSRQT